MKTNLQQLAEHLLNERAKLKKEIDAVLEEMDYLSAHYLAQRLGTIGRELQLLKKIDHTNEIALQLSQANLAAYEKKMKRVEEKDKLTRWKHERILDRLKNKVQDIADKPPRLYIDDQKIDDLIAQLLDHQINGFRWFLHRGDNFYLEFNLFSSQTLAIAFTALMYLNNEEWLVNEKRMEALGFHFSTSSNRWERHLDVTYFQNAISLKQWLAKIVFDVFLYHEMDEEMSIEVY